LPVLLIRPVLDASVAVAAAVDVAGSDREPPSTDSSANRATGSAAPVTTTATTTKVPKVYVFVSPTSPAPAVHPQTAEVVAWLQSKIGIPYVWGGEGATGFDCSGLSMMAWRSVGVSIHHNSRAQFGQTDRIALADLAPGDLLFYGDPIHHLGIYIGGGKMIEAPRTGLTVRVSSIQRRDLVGAGRVRWST
jgi:peptidoglycan DL-endopeptidase CwlO